MRPFRVFNDVSRVRVILRLGGYRLGGITQLAALLHLTLSVLVIIVWSPIPAVIGFLIGLAVIVVFAVRMQQLDPSGALSEPTILRLLIGGVRHRYRANFELPEL